jgi:PIN domain nuclease of toxin-antitoxin system
VIHLDTHVAIWLVAGEKRRLRPVSKWLRAAPLRVSPVVVLEMELLREIGRIRLPADEILAVLTDDYGVAEAEGDLREVARVARGLGWTRDPFDRLIVAHALASRATLLTADETIRRHCARARWGD